MKRGVQAIAWVGATALLLYFIGKIDRTVLRSAMDMVSWGWIAVAIAANASILVVWAGLWWFVAPDAERPRYGEMFQVTAIASALMNTIPFLGGHAAAVVLMETRARMTRTGALSVMALDQLGEGLAKVFVFSVVALAAPIPEWMRVGIGTVCLAVGGLLVAMVVVAHRHEEIHPREGEPLTILNRGRILAASWARRMETLRSAKRSILALLLAIGTKAAEAAGLLAVQHAFGIELSLGATALVLAAVMLGSMLPVAPGNVGTYEAGAFIAYRHLGVDPAMATILAVAAHLCFVVPAIGAGYLLGSWKLRSVVTPADASSPAAS